MGQAFSLCNFQRRLCRATKFALSRIPLKTLKSDDKEVCGSSLGEQCSVCLERFRPGDLVRLMPCAHVFHRRCVDPWLEENRSCPLCKLDILSYFGLKVRGRPMRPPIIVDVHLEQQMAQLHVESTEERFRRHRTRRAGTTRDHRLVGQDAFLTPWNAQTTSRNVLMQDLSLEAESSSQLEYSSDEDIPVLHIQLPPRARNLTEPAEDRGSASRQKTPGRRQSPSTPVTTLHSEVTVHSLNADQVPDSVDHPNGEYEVVKPMNPSEPSVPPAYYKAPADLFDANLLKFIRTSSGQDEKIPEETQISSSPTKVTRVSVSPCDEQK